jgi:uncharacterized protein
VGRGMRWDVNGYNRGMKRTVAVCILLALVLGAQVGGAAPKSKRATQKRGSAAPGYVDSVEAWRARRLARLTSDSGWLTISGLFWLNPGRNILGSDSTNYVVFPKDASPPKAAIIQLEFHPATHAAEMELIAVPGAGIMRDTTHVTREMLTLDADGSSPVYTLGRLKFWVIQRGLRYAVRVRDPESPVRKSFVGIENYPVDPKMCVEGRLIPNPETTYVLVPNIVGYMDSMLSPGIVTFAIGDTTLRLTPVLETPTDTSLFFVFRDATSGTETYGGGRFFYADVEKDGRVFLDFNKAYNPPCAFNPNTTCPLPPEGNDLPIPIRAGEKAYAGPPGHVFGPKH